MTVTRRFAPTLMALTALTACGSVEVPSERFYRLSLPASADPVLGRAGVLRVQDLQLGNALDSDRLLRQSGVRLEPRPLARWIAPLDRLVTDAMVLGLSRSRVCELVKGSGDAGGEDWTLRGRIVDFVEADDPAGAAAHVTLELWLEGERGELLFEGEFAVVEPLGGSAAEAVVAALSRGLERVVHDVVARMQQRDLFAAVRARRRVDVASPPR